MDTGIQAGLATGFDDAPLPAAGLKKKLPLLADCIVDYEVSREMSLEKDFRAWVREAQCYTDRSAGNVVSGTLHGAVRTSFAAATENPRYALTGVLWELEGEVARLVATDGRRLAVSEGKATLHGAQDTKGQTHVVPTKAMQLLERNLGDPEEVVRVSLRPNEALFKSDRAVIYSRLVEGRYPPYREVFPKKQTAKIPLVVGPFHSAVRQAAIMTDEETKKVVFTFDKHKLTMQAHGPATGRSKVDLPIDYDGKQIKIAFDPKFVTEMLRVLNPDDALTLELIDGNSVALFRYGTNYSYIAMPLS